MASFSPAFPRDELARFFAAAQPFAFAPTSPATGPRIVLTQAFDNLGQRLRTRRQERATIDRHDAPRFNVFDFIQPKETVLSRVLFFLLDPRGSHGQGEQFLAVLLARLRPGETFATQQAILAREASTYTLLTAPNRRIDLTATLPGFVLGLEIKKDAKEGYLQVEEYCQHLQNVAHQNFCLIFLTRNGDAPQMSDHLQQTEYKAKRQLELWTWQNDIKPWLKECHEQCGSNKVKHFLQDFEGYIDKCLMMTTPWTETDEQPS